MVDGAGELLGLSCPASAVNAMVARVFTSDEDTPAAVNRKTSREKRGRERALGDLIDE